METSDLLNELNRIKEGIRCQGTMIIDGNDMFDWGWKLQEDANKERWELQKQLEKAKIELSKLAACRNILETMKPMITARMLSIENGYNVSAEEPYHILSQIQNALK